MRNQQELGLKKDKNQYFYTFSHRFNMNFTEIDMISVKKFQIFMQNCKVTFKYSNIFIY